MRDELLGYYERELIYMRRMGAEFAEKYPKIASNLRLEAHRCEDPHVERLIEAFAFLAARVHLKIDDDFPEITQALLSIVYPHYTRPIPSMTVAQFDLDPQKGKLSAGLPIPRGSLLYSRPVDGTPCKFRTCYDTTLWPVTVSQAQWLTPDRLQPAVRATDAVAALRLELSCFSDISFDKLKLKKLRFYLNGESQIVHKLYELLCSRCTRILLRDPGAKREPIVLPRHALQPAGFAEDESVLPYPRRSFIGYRLLQEYFTLPEKFFFIDVDVEALTGGAFKDKAELIFLIGPFEQGDRALPVDAGMLRLGCTPIVNLFQLTAEPILLDDTRSEYLVVPDGRRPNTVEIFSIDEVLSSNPHSAEVTYFEPLYSYRHGAASGPRAYWHAVRRASETKGDEATDVFISLSDLSASVARPEGDSLTVRCTCTNSTLPSRLPFGDEAGDFELEAAPSVKRIVSLRNPPTATLRPPLGQRALWRLMSHLSLNYLSIGSEGKEALQEILRLYDFSGSAFLEKQIAGIVRLNSSPHSARVVSEHGIAFARGTRVEIEFDEEQFVGGGVYLFANVIERFLGHYVSMNSFSKLVAKTRQRQEVLQEWPPRAGQSILM